VKIRALLVAIAIAMSVAGHSAIAQSAPPDTRSTFGIMAGSAAVTGAIASASLGGFSPGVSIGALGQFPITSRLSMRADVIFHWIRDDVCGGNRDCGSSPNMSYVVSGGLAVHARLNDPSTSWSPYILAGAAAYSCNFEDGNVKALRPSQFGLQGGVGFEVRQRTTTMFIEARYLDIAPGGLVPIMIGVRF
jgi:hypothetical protein